MATRNTITRTQSQKSLESPKSTVKIVPLDKDKERDYESSKFREDLRSMFNDFEERLSGKIQALDRKFTGMFNQFQKDMEDLRQEVTQSNEKVTKFTEKVGQIENSLEFHSESLKETNERHEKVISETRGYIDEKIEELNKKLLLLEKQDRKYNLLIYGIPEERDEDVCEKMRELFLHDLNICSSRVDNMYFAHGHRLPTRARTGPRPIIIRFTNFGDRDLVLSNAPKLAGTKRRILSDLPLKMKEERGKLANQAFKIRQQEKLQTRIKELGLTISLEVRKDQSEPWVKRL